MIWDFVSCLIGLFLGLAVFPLLFLASKKELSKKQALLISAIAYVLALLIAYLSGYK